MSIKEVLKKRASLIAIFIFLVTSLAFGLGYLMGYQGNRAPIVIEINESSGDIENVVLE